MKNLSRTRSWTELRINECKVTDFVQGTDSSFSSLSLHIRKLSLLPHFLTIMVEIDGVYRVGIETIYGPLSLRVFPLHRTGSRCLVHRRLGRDRGLKDRWLGYKN